MSAVISVQRHTITLAAGTASASATLTGTAASNTANCIPFVTSRVTAATGSSGTDDLHSGYCVDAYFSGSTVVAAANPLTTFSELRALVVEVTVVEFDSARVDIQQGTYDFTASATTSCTAALSPSVTLANTFLYHTWQGPDTDDDNYGSFLIKGDFNSTSQLGFSRGDNVAQQVTGHWYTAEATSGDFTVQTATIQLNVTTSNTATITSVDTASSFIVGSHSSTNSTDDNQDNTVDVVLTNGTTVTMQRAVAQDVIESTHFVVTMLDNTSVQRGTITAQGATATEYVTGFTAVDLDVAMVHVPGSTGSFVSGSFPGATFQFPPEAHVGITFADSGGEANNSLKVEHFVSAGAGADNDISWEIIEWDTGAAAPARRVMVVS